MDDRPESSFVPDVVPEDDRQFVAERARLGNRVGWGETPAILVVDMTEAFLGERATDPDPVPHTASLLARARETSTPVYYTVPGESTGYPDGYPVAIKASPASARGPDVELTPERRDWLDRIDAIPPEIEPRDDEVVIEKPRASAFFDTHLGNVLRYEGVDTLVVTGLTTSGCVRATAVAAHSANLRTIVPVECVADSVSISHDIALFDLDHRYADVTSVAAVKDRLSTGD
ncbi:MAG: isochorismatase family protein [Halanaeroarchaeum sp.]